MERLKSFKSSNIEAAEYDPQTHDLHVTFKSGSKYHFPKVQPESWAGLQKAKSKGAFVAAHISSMYKGRRLEE